MSLEDRRKWVIEDLDEAREAARENSSKVADFPPGALVVLVGMVLDELHRIRAELEELNARERARD